LSLFTALLVTAALCRLGPGVPPVFLATVATLIAAALAAVTSAAFTFLFVATAMAFAVVLTARLRIPRARLGGLGLGLGLAGEPAEDLLENGGPRRCGSFLARHGRWCGLRRGDALDRGLRTLRLRLLDRG